LLFSRQYEACHANERGVWLKECIEYFIVGII
jgi:hypothetical protein